MSKRISFWLAWLTWVFFLVITFFAEFLTLKNAPSDNLLGNMLYDLVLLLFITVGAFIASHRPENPIGWIICLAALIWALSDLSLEYGVYALITAPGSLPLGIFVSLLGSAGRGTAWFLIMTFLLLLFPNGRLPSSRWRPLAWLIVGLLVAIACTCAHRTNFSDTSRSRRFDPGDLRYLPTLTHSRPASDRSSLLQAKI